MYCILYGKDKLIATIGVENLIVIQEKDAILICDKNRAQDVKNVVDRLGKEGKEKYLYLRLQNLRQEIESDTRYFN